MAKARLWSGVAVDVQSALATALTITAVSKANPGVVTFTGTQPAAGSYVVIKATGMNRINNRVFRVGSPTATTFQLVGENTTLYDTFIDGTAQVITFGVSLNSVTDLNASGGEPERRDTSTIHEFMRTEINGISSAAVYTIGLLWDPDDPAQMSFIQSSETNSDVAIRFRWPDGATAVFVGGIGFSGLPTGSAHEKVTTNCTITMSGRAKYYGS